MTHRTGKSTVESGHGWRNAGCIAQLREFRTYYFKRDGTVDDISDLDPGSDDIGQEGWGGLTEFSGHVGDIVADVANRMRTETS